VHLLRAAGYTLIADGLSGQYNAPEFGFLVFLPTFFADEVGFGTAGWLRLLFVLGATNIFFNLIFGVLSDRIGWQRTISLFGGFGCAISTLIIYFVPRTLGGN